MTMLIQFDERPVRILVIDGRPALLARQVGAAIGYADEGKGLIRQITGEWADEFREGHDYQYATHAQITAALADDSRGAESAPLENAGSSVVNPRGALVLYESGVYLACTLSRKEAGRRLRRRLADEILPQLARDGAYSADRQVVDGHLVEPAPPAFQIDPATIRPSATVEEIRARLDALSHATDPTSAAVRAHIAALGVVPVTGATSWEAIRQDVIWAQNYLADPQMSRMGWSELARRTGLPLDAIAYAAYQKMTNNYSMDMINARSASSAILAPAERPARPAPERPAEPPLAPDPLKTRLAIWMAGQPDPILTMDAVRVLFPGPRFSNEEIAGAEAILRQLGLISERHPTPSGVVTQWTRSGQTQNGAWTDAAVEADRVYWDAAVKAGAHRPGRRTLAVRWGWTESRTLARLKRWGWNGSPSDRVSR